MNKADKIFIIIALIVGGILLVSPRFLTTSGKRYAVVNYHDQEILRIDMSEDNTYTVQGDLGPITLEVNNNRIRVITENSPLHYCKIQGWVEFSNTPIICLPNAIWISIINGESSGSDATVE